MVEQQPDGTWTVIEGSDPLMEEEQELQQVIASCLEREESRGVLAEDNLRYLRKTTRAGRERIAFSDRTLESQMLSSLIRNSLAIGAGGLRRFLSSACCWRAGPSGRYGRPGSGSGNLSPMRPTR